jgi:CRISPR-associated endonuclease/helicase Cas3
VGAAIQVAEAVEDLAGAESPLLFRVAGVATVHHSRFSPDDRRLLDRAVEARVGRDRPEGGLVITGTQTLEISLDLDAALLITDLCPIDVLLQRIGRLHRHGGRNRPSGFDVPRALVLTPRARDLAPLTRRSRHGLGLGVYDDLRIIEATWRQIEAQPRWAIPAMNRSLVEAATHPERLAAVEHDLSSRNPSWRQHFMTGEGKLAAELFAASHARLDRSQPFDRFGSTPMSA